MFWNRKKPKPPRHEPREHHYVFAHYTLRAACTHDPAWFFATIGSAERQKFVAWLWDTTAKRVGRPVAELDPADLAVTTGKLKDNPVIVFTMPPAEAVGEAHLVALVLTGLATASAERPAGVLCFTLEHGTTLDGSPRTVLCEWTPQGHRNLGDGPPATVQAFLDVLEAKT